jgi:uncharacterized protein YciI
VPHYAVTRERGASWDPARPMTEQERWAEHAAFMNGLVTDSFVVVGGPLGDGLTILLLVAAESEEAVHARLEEDPWTPMGLLRITRIEPWQILLGEPNAAA